MYDSPEHDILHASNIKLKDGDMVTITWPTERGHLGVVEYKVWTPLLVRLKRYLKGLLG